MSNIDSNSQQNAEIDRLPIRYLNFCLSFKPLINEEIIKVFQNCYIFNQFKHNFLSFRTTVISINQWM